MIDKKMKDKSFAGFQKPQERINEIIFKVLKTKRIIILKGHDLALARKSKF